MRARHLLGVVTTMLVAQTLFAQVAPPSAASALPPPPPPPPSAASALLPAPPPPAGTVSTLPPAPPPPAGTVSTLPPAPPPPAGIASAVPPPPSGAVSLTPYGLPSALSTPVATTAAQAEQPLSRRASLMERLWLYVVLAYSHTRLISVLVGPERDENPDGDRSANIGEGRFMLQAYVGVLGATVLVGELTKPRRGIPHAIAAGTLTGMVGGYLWTGADMKSPRASEAIVLLGGAGGLAGGAIAGWRHTTPVQASYLTSTAIWTSALSGFGYGGFSNASKSDAAKAGLVGLSVGTLAGLATGSYVSVVAHARAHRRCGGVHRLSCWCEGQGGTVFTDQSTPRDRWHGCRTPDGRADCVSVCRRPTADGTTFGVESDVRRHRADTSRESTRVAGVW